MGAGLQKSVERNAETFHRTVEEMGKFTEAVSYTHIDVYKRKGL